MGNGVAVGEGTAVEDGIAVGDDGTAVGGTDVTSATGWLLLDAPLSPLQAIKTNKNMNQINQNRLILLLQTTNFTSKAFQNLPYG